MLIGINVWIGGDTAASDYSTINTYSNGKIFRIDNRFIIGGCGDERLMSVLKYQLNPPHQYDWESVEGYMNVRFVNAVREAYKNTGSLNMIREREMFLGSAFLVGYKGRLFSFWENFALFESMAKYDAIGSGRDVALGSLHATDILRLQDNIVIDQVTRIHMSLAAACDLTPYVREPCDILIL